MTSWCRTYVVGSYPANPFGLYDMTGNAAEWCSDYYDDKYYNNSPKEDPENLTKSDARVMRGGSCAIELGNCRAAYRFGMPAGLRVRLARFPGPRSPGTDSFRPYRPRLIPHGDLIEELADLAAPGCPA